jgi:peptide deformylase
MYELIDEASKVLRTPPPVFDFENPPEDPKEIETNLASAMERFGGIGLSANQLGLDYRVFVMRTADSGIKAFFNPEITKVSQDTDLMKEGCLSFPDLYLMIKRSKEIELKYQDAEGEEHTIYLTGLGARCVQHECDHLNGILFIQRASRLKVERALKSRPKERRKRIDYETRIAIARAIQERESSDTSESDNGTGIEGLDSVSEDARAS